jgi:hypothetical protein
MVEKKVGPLGQTTAGKLLILLLCPGYRDHANILSNYIIIWQQWDYGNDEIAATIGSLLRYKGYPKISVVIRTWERSELSFTAARLRAKPELSVTFPQYLKMLWRFFCKRAVVFYYLGSWRSRIMVLCIKSLPRNVTAPT